MLLPSELPFLNLEILNLTPWFEEEQTLQQFLQYHPQFGGRRNPFTPCKRMIWWCWPDKSRTWLSLRLGVMWVQIRDMNPKSEGSWDRRTGVVTFTVEIVIVRSTDCESVQTWASCSNYMWFHCNTTEPVQFSFEVLVANNYQSIALKERIYQSSWKRNLGIRSKQRSLMSFLQNVLDDQNSTDHCVYWFKSPKDVQFLLWSSL